MLDSNNSVSKTAHNDATVKIKHSKKFWQCFWLSFLVLSLAYAWYCFYVPGNKINWANSFVAAQQQSVETGKPIVLYFTASWCVPCRIMKRQVWADVEVTDIINEDFIPLSIDIDNLDHAELMNRFQIKGAPVTIVVDSEGNALRWRAGGISKADFLELILGAGSSEQNSR